MNTSPLSGTRLTVGLICTNAMTVLTVGTSPHRKYTIIAAEARVSC